jgi:hypothetical protein
LLLFNELAWGLHNLQEDLRGLRKSYWRLANFRLPQFVPLKGALEQNQRVTF